MRATAILFFFLTLLISCSSGDIISIDTSQKEISIYFEQSGEIIEPRDNIVELKRAPFTVIIFFKNADGILIHASLNDNTYRKAEMGFTIDELPGFINPSISEELFNSESVIYLSDDAPGYWYYTDETDHRFNSVSPVKNGFLCRREITGIIDKDSSNDKITLNNIEGNTIYMVAMKTDWTTDYTRRIELNRKLYKIRFAI